MKTEKVLSDHDWEGSDLCESKERGEWPFK